MPCPGDLDYNCVHRRGDRVKLRVVVDEIPQPDIPVTLYLPREFEVVEYYHSLAMVRMYTRHFMERLAQGKAQLEPVIIVR